MAFPVPRGPIRRSGLFPPTRVRCSSLNRRLWPPVQLGRGPFRIIEGRRPRTMVSAHISTRGKYVPSGPPTAPPSRSPPRRLRHLDRIRRGRRTGARSRQTAVSGENRTLKLGGGHMRTLSFTPDGSGITFVTQFIPSRAPGPPFGSDRLFCIRHRSSHPDTHLEPAVPASSRSRGRRFMGTRRHSLRLQTKRGCGRLFAPRPAVHSRCRRRGSPSA